MNIKSLSSAKKLSLEEKKKIYSTIKKAFKDLIDFEKLKTLKRNPKVIKTSALFLEKDLKANLHNSGIENCNTDFMLEGIGRGMIRYSRRLAWLNRHYEWAARVPVIEGRRARVVDLGCDVGEIRKVMSGSFYYPNPLYLGIDIDNERLTKGFMVIGTSRTPAIYIQHDITFSLEFIKSSSIDVVFLGETIEHFEKKYGEKLLSEISRILCKNGKFFISTPNKRNSKGYEFHVYEYTPEELVELVETKQLKVDRVYGWITSEKLLLSRMKEKDKQFYCRLIGTAHKDICLPIMAHLSPEYGDAICVEGYKV
jgi:SAM-dependent methyltransferase